MLPKKLLFTVGGKTKNGTVTFEDNLAGILFFAFCFFVKLNILSPYDPAIVLLGIYPKELKNYVHTKL